MKNIKEKRGITLIALAVTIVVILILAGVTIDAVFSDDGIINKAKEAANAMNNAVANDQVQINDLLEGLNEIMNSEWNNEENTTEKPETGDPNYTEDGVPIPQGFYYVGGKKEEGIVISDEKEDENKGTNHEVAKSLKGNQFVWIPVENMNEFIRYEGYMNGILENGLNKITEPYPNGPAEEKEEFNNMILSVEKYKGFYIGRYEAGNLNGAVTSKQGIKVWNNIKWGESATYVGTEGAVTKSREMYTDKQKYKVTSTLIYGVQWDAALVFIDPSYKTGTCTSTSYIVNSTGKGNYSGNLQNTGNDASYSIKNIYDMAGNVNEWTMEAYITNGDKTTRGGAYSNTPLIPASFRMMGYTPSSKTEATGFRVALYIDL